MKLFQRTHRGLVMPGRITHGIQIVDFDFYSVEAFNWCENSNDVLMAVQIWDNVYPLLKVIPVEWNYSIPYGLLHSHTPSETVKQFLSAIQTVLHQ